MLDESGQPRRDQNPIRLPAIYNFEQSDQHHKMDLLRPDGPALAKHGRAGQLLPVRFPALQISSQRFQKQEHHIDRAGGVRAIF